MTDELQQSLRQRVEACFLDAEKFYQRRFPRPEISLKMRGQSAGAAHLQGNRLRFNPTLLAENRDDFLREVIPHEVAHLLCWHLFGKVKPHGPQWQQVMTQAFGLAPRVRHSFAVDSVAPPTWRYRCHCQAHELTLRRHNKVCRGQVRYHCRHCNSELSLDQGAIVSQQ